MHRVPISPRTRTKTELSVRAHDRASSVRLLRIGIASPAQVRARTIAIAKGEVHLEPREPKLWIPSIEALGRIMSTSNIAMLDTVRDRRPESVKALASLIDRAPSNVFRTLRAMERMGLVSLHPAGGRALRPEVLFDRVTIDLNLLSTRDTDVAIPAAAAS